MDREINRIISNIDFENIQKHPNILIAASFWDEKRYHAAKVCYKFMRMIDDLLLHTHLYHHKINSGRFYNASLR